MPQLVLLQSGKATPYQLTNKEVVIGRHPECDIQLDSNMVSRKHARLVPQGDAWLLEDLGSGNGSFINGTKIEAPTRLEHEARIKLGPILFRFESQPKQARTRSPLDLGEPTAGSSTFAMHIATGADDQATVMGATKSGERFGMLEVRPEAKLKAVLEISHALAGTVNIDLLLPKILDTLFSIFPQADRGCILLRNKKGDMIPAAQKHRNPQDDSSVKLSRTILNKVLTDKAGILSADAASDARFEASASISSLTIRSMMCVPLLNVEGEPLGVINIDTLNSMKQFKQEDLDLLTAVAGQAALTYESTRLLQSHLEKQKQDSEMKIATAVQQALLPNTFPQVEGYDFFASYDAAQAVGGDYYDCFLLPNNKIALSFGDVAGKGVPGALIMSRMSTVVQTTLQFVDDVEEAVKVINNRMCSKMVEGRFVTYVLIILDLTTHEMSLVNAGHMTPLIRRVDGSVDEFPDETIGIPIGIMEDYPYDVVRRTIEPGETVVIITDGVDEAMDPEDHLYTKERVIEFVHNASPIAAELAKSLLADVRKHANGRPQNDDITIMAFSRNA